MPYALLDDQFHANPKVKAAGLDGAGLYALALSYCGDYTTDGFVPKWWAEGIAKRQKRVIHKLKEAGLWHETATGDTLEMVDRKGNPIIVQVTEPGYFIPDFVLLNVSSVEAKRRHQEKSQAGRKGAIKRWGDNTSHSSSDSTSHHPTNGNGHSTSDSRSHSKRDGKTDSSHACAHGTPTPTPDEVQALAQDRKAEAGLTRTNPAPAIELHPNTADPIVKLTLELRDRDPGTEHTIRANFDGLPEAAFAYAREEILRCRDTSTSDSGLAMTILQRIADTGLIGDEVTPPPTTQATPNGDGKPKKTPLDRALALVPVTLWDYDPVALGHELDQLGVTDAAERRSVGAAVEAERLVRGVQIEEGAA